MNINTQILFVSTNSYKIEEFSKFEKKLNYPVKYLKTELPEIQAYSCSEVAKFSAKWAADHYMKPSICEDIGLFIPSLEGFPGPYLSYIEKTIKLEGLLQLLSDKENREAFWEYSVGFCIPSENPVVFTAFQYGEITTAPQGKSEWIDKIFRLNGERETIAQSYEQDTFKRNNEHYLELIDYINNKIT